MSEIFIEIGLIAILILVNGLFSMTEIAVVSSRRVRLAKDAELGSKGAETAIKLQEEPGRFLSTVQIGITLVGILSGAFGGALLSDEVSDVVKLVPALEPYSQTLGFLIVIAIITYFSLVVGELVPKNLALNRPETIAKLFSRPMDIISKVTAPVVWFLSTSTALILKAFGIKETPEAAITEDEIRAHIAHGTELGVLDQTEKDLLESVIELDDRRVTSMMTPRLKMLWIDVDDDPEINRGKLIDSPYSRLPVAKGELDNILGIVKSRDILSQILGGEDLNIEKILKQPIFVPETRTGLELLETFREGHSMMAVIINEFGSVEGLVTMNDVLEEIVGDLPTSGKVTQNFTVRDDGSFLMDGDLPVLDMVQALNVEIPAGEQEMYQTLAGFILARMEKLPVEGDNFDWNGFRFEVVDLDGRRIDKVLVTSLDSLKD